MARMTFQLWRLMGSVTCFAVAMGILRFTYFEVDRYGGGFFPTLCVIVAFLLIVAGVGMLFRRIREFVLRTVLTLLQFLGP